MLWQRAATCITALVAGVVLISCGATSADSGRSRWRPADSDELVVQIVMQEGAAPLDQVQVRRLNPDFPAFGQIRDEVTGGDSMAGQSAMSSMWMPAGSWSARVDVSEGFAELPLPATGWYCFDLSRNGADDATLATQHDGEYSGDESAWLATRCFVVEFAKAGIWEIELAPEMGAWIDLVIEGKRGPLPIDPFVLQASPALGMGDLIQYCGEIEQGSWLALGLGQGKWTLIAESGGRRGGPALRRFAGEVDIQEAGVGARVSVTLQEVELN